MNMLRKLWQRGRDLLPIDGFHFDRPIVVLQSDDWGRAGLRDREGLEQLTAAGLVLGERPYDFYTLETAEDLADLRAVLRGHRDSDGRSPSLEMNFVVANLDLEKMASEKSFGGGIPVGFISCRSPKVFPPDGIGPVCCRLTVKAFTKDSSIPPCTAPHTSAGQRSNAISPKLSSLLERPRKPSANIVECRHALHPLAYAVDRL